MFDQKQSIRDEAEELSEFFGIRIEQPSLERTLGTPKLSGDHYSVLEYNPVMPGSKHEMRHKAHRDILESVIEGQEGEVMNYYEGELMELNVPSEVKGVSTSFYSAAVSATKRFSSFDDMDKLIQDEDTWPADDLADIVFSKNGETDFQEEVFAHDSSLEFSSYFSLGSALTGYAGFTNAEVFQSMDQVMAFPEVAAFSAFALSASYAMAKDGYLAYSPESLTEDNLADYSKEDKRRAMLYNSQVDDSIDDFLETLDNYGIE